MKTTQEIRRENLRLLVMKAAGESGDMGKGLTALVKEAASRGKTLNRPTLYQILSEIKTAAGSIRNVGDDLARDIEDALRLERGWMDNAREMVLASPNPGVKAAILAELVMLMDRMSDDLQEDLLASARDLLAGSGAASVVANEAK